MPPLPPARHLVTSGDIFSLTVVCFASGLSWEVSRDAAIHAMMDTIIPPCSALEENGPHREWYCLLGGVALVE